MPSCFTLTMRDDVEMSRTVHALFSVSAYSPSLCTTRDLGVQGLRGEAQKSTVIFFDNTFPCDGQVTEVVVHMQRRVTVFISAFRHKRGTASQYKLVGKHDFIMEQGLQVRRYSNIYISIGNIQTYSISQEICTRLLLCCALLWLCTD